MARFIYRAIDSKGKVEKGVQDVASQEELISALQGRGLTITSIVEEKKAAGPARRKLHHRVKLDDLILYSRQMSTLVGAGIPLLRCLKILSLQTESKRLLDANEEVVKDVEAGRSFKDALNKHPKIFSKFWVSLVETGEASGQLPSVLDQLAAYLEAAGALRRRVFTAMIYPAIVLAVATGVIFFFTVFVVPIFRDLFETLAAGAELPLITRMVIALSGILRQYSLQVFIIVVALIVLFRRYVATERGRINFDRFKLGLPLFGGLFRMVATESFAGGLGTLIRSGVPLLGALEIIERTIDNRAVGKMLESVRTEVREGKSLAEPLEKIAVFSPIVTQMVAVGEETGELSGMLEKVTAYCRERTEAFVARLTTIMEPVLIVFLAVIVAFLAVSMYLPIFKLAVAIR